jgi:hypothetical protein
MPKKKLELFDNPRVRAARAKMTPEQLRDFKIKGEEMFRDINFEGPTFATPLGGVAFPSGKELSIKDGKGATETVKSTIGANPDLFKESVAYILEGIKSGLHPSLLSSDEKGILSEFLGETWYDKFGYTKEDLNELN